MRLTFNFFIAVALLLPVTPAALADSIQLSVDSSFLANVFSPNDNYWGTYSTADQGFIDHPSIKSLASTIFPSVSIFIPTGNVVTSAILQVLRPATSVQGAGVVYSVQALPPPDWTSPSIAPTFSNTGMSDVYADLDLLSGGLWPIVDGNKVSTGDLNLLFDLYGSIRGQISTPGVNWTGYISGDGKANIPYTVQLDVTYSPVPEPASIVLLGTGIIGLAGFAYRKLLSYS